MSHGVCVWAGRATAKNGGFRPGQTQTACSPTAEVLPVCAPPACADPAACTDAETAAISAVLGGAPAHTPGACLERGRLDRDCCAADDQGTCQDGYAKTSGDSCYEPADGTVLFSSVCTPTATIMEDCTDAGCEAVMKRRVQPVPLIVKPS